MTGLVMMTKGGGCAGGDGGMGRRQKERERLKRNRTSSRWWREDVISAVHNMEIGCPTNVRHITHATFDRFNDFLGLPVEFEVEVPCRVPSAR
ncbi:hypothetical protein CISIN_1g041607mg [Citrus sinensis]|uniref:CRIB domain-containing protein n=1 Tax=Citrus sinensis TaxID=2711 RepID=A0A067FGG0_CITSI|nr:hypothetical protein CISIN_1g041607mg [Citrus sinensis]